ncbi:type 2 isopentenyl-diphosphate Delta-isomerase [Candidatus Marsarchaeota archaeon]|nr:type 2 isopentenyl-diphosphate Delta-isomerase [Candidatus Marsarchaeota archaeon]MCL5404525.1 type 2 isopentenyl-diphosphate Delta-isomerase [Candidatus Marsarchaeota archaeon]
MDAKKASKISEIMKRKEEHIKICLDSPVQAKQARTLFSDVHLLNNSLPEIDFDDIDTSTKFLGKSFSAPFMVGAMTGGAELAKKINGNIAEAVEELGLGMALGSQRAALYDRLLEDTYTIARKKAPSAFIGANIGGAQISKGLGIEDVRRLIEMIDADALYIHLNPAQEIVQPEGEPRYRDVMGGISNIIKSVKKPVIAKEVGFGLSPDVAKRLSSIGISAVEIAGMGGTSYAAVEWYRAKSMGLMDKIDLGNLLWDWGIPTAASLYMIRKASDIPIISSGGLRTGMDIAKSIAMGASMTAMALPILRPATESASSVKRFISKVLLELKAVMFLLGARNVEELRRTPCVITGELALWKDFSDKRQL